MHHSSKDECGCHNLFLGYSLKILPFSFQNKNKIIIARRSATWKKLAKKGFQM
jgi:hypothetical protein